MRTHASILIIAMVLYLTFPKGASAQWVQISQPPGDTILSLKAIESDLYVTTNSGCFVSRDNGDSWTAASSAMPVGTQAHGVNNVGRNLFAAVSPDGLLVSRDNGVSWKVANSGLPKGIRSEVDHMVANGSNLFIGTLSDGVFLSTNDGASWRAASSGLPKDAWVRDLAVSGTNLLAVMGVDGGPLFLSTDNGSNWEAIKWSSDSANWVDYLVEGSNCLFAVTFSKILRSKDNGVSWELLAPKTDWGDMGSLVILSSLRMIGTKLFLVTAGPAQIFRSTDNGDTWTPCKPGLPEEVRVTGLVERGSNLIASTWSHGVFLSTDKSATWKAINSGLTEGVTGVSITLSDKYLFAVTTYNDIFRLPLADLSLEGRLEARF